MNGKNFVIILEQQRVNLIEELAFEATRAHRYLPRDNAPQIFSLFALTLHTWLMKGDAPMSYRTRLTECFPRRL